MAAWQQHSCPYDAPKPETLNTKPQAANRNLVVGLGPPQQRWLFSDIMGPQLFETSILRQGLSRGNMVTSARLNVFHAEPYSAHDLISGDGTAKGTIHVMCLG